MPQNPTFEPASDARAFRDALGRFATGVTVVTTNGPDGPVGFTANSFASVSMDPPLVLWSPARASQRFGVFTNAKHYAIHILAAEQSDLSMAFVRGGLGFDALKSGHNPEGVPILTNTLARFDCVQHATYDGGDHQIILGRVLRCAMRDGAPLVFSQGGYGAFNPVG